VASQLLHQIEIATDLEMLIDPLVPTAVESLLGLTVALSVKLRTIAGKPLYKAFGTSVELGQKAVAGAICFSAIVRENRFHHKMVIHEPFELISTGNTEQDVVTNLKNITKVMEKQIKSIDKVIKGFARRSKKAPSEFIESEIRRRFNRDALVDELQF
jgi:hypothetical protein